MPVIKVERSHALGEEEATRRAKELIREFADRLKADVKWNGQDASFKGTGFTGSARVAADSIAVNVDLGMLLSPMKGKVETRLKAAIDEKFG